MGNNLFQWSFARIISKMSGVPMFAPPIPLFSATYQDAFAYPQKIPFILPEKCFNVSVDDWVNKAKFGDVLIRGWPHNTAYFEPHRNWLKTELVPEEGDYAQATRDDIVLHIRWGDYFDRYKDRYSYPQNSICSLLSKLRYQRCLIVTDTPSNPLANTLLQTYRGILVANSLAHDYRTLYFGRRVIMSPSTFSWWAVWTGYADEVYQPYEMGYWKSQNEFALELIGKNIKRYDEHGAILNIRS